jgi:hypothetical protein
MPIGASASASWGAAGPQDLQRNTRQAARASARSFRRAAPSSTVLWLCLPARAIMGQGIVVAGGEVMS